MAFNQPCLLHNQILGVELPHAIRFFLEGLHVAFQRYAAHSLERATERTRVRETGFHASITIHRQRGVLCCYPIEPDVTHSRNVHLQLIIPWSEGNEMCTFTCCLWRDLPSFLMTRSPSLVSTLNWAMASSAPEKDT